MSTTTFHWGHGIALVYAAFAISMVGAVVIAARNHNPGLVQKNYYDLDINYQKRIEQKQNTAGLTAMPQIVHKREAMAINVQLPADMIASAGKVKAFRPAMATGEITQVFQGVNTFQIPLKPTDRGYFRVELEWLTNNKDYYYETVIIIP